MFGKVSFARTVVCFIFVLYLKRYLIYIETSGISLVLDWLLNVWYCGISNLFTVTLLKMEYRRVLHVFLRVMIVGNTVRKQERVRDTETHFGRWQSLLFPFMLCDVPQPPFALTLSSRTPAERLKGRGSLRKMRHRKTERGRTTTSSGSIFWKRWQTWERALFWHACLGMKGGLVCFEELPMFPNALGEGPLVFEAPPRRHTGTPPVPTERGI